MSLKLESHPYWKVNQIEMSLKSECHKNWTVTQIKCHETQNVTQFGMLFQLEYHSN